MQGSKHYLHFNDNGFAFNVDAWLLELLGMYSIPDAKRLLSRDRKHEKTITRKIREQRSSFHVRISGFLYYIIFPLYRGVSEGLTLAWAYSRLDLRWVGSLTGFIRDQQGPMYHHLPPNSIGKKSWHREQQMENNIGLLLCSMGCRFESWLSW